MTFLSAFLGAFFGAFLAGLAWNYYQLWRAKRRYRKFIFDSMKSNLENMASGFDRLARDIFGDDQSNDDRRH